MSTHALRPWTDLVKLHPDVEAGALTEVVFAIDLGAIAANDPNVPVVNWDPEAFFRATYLTADLRKLLDEVLASLSDKSGYNRVFWVTLTLQKRIHFRIFYWIVPIIPVLRFTKGWMFRKYYYPENLMLINSFKNLRPKVST